MKRWFEKNNIKSGDEVVLQLIDKERFVYRLIPERLFLLRIQDMQHNLDNSETEEDASRIVSELGRWTASKRKETSFSEYYRLANASPSADRGSRNLACRRGKERTTPHMRALLRHLYEGHCQLCDFWFLKKDHEPYFEVHHLEASAGHHPKNLVVVCGNCHNQFEYADVQQRFNSDGWLVNVCFNGRPFSVTNVLLATKIEAFYKEVFI